MNLKITGTGRALPEASVTNAELSAFLDTGDEWITSRTGIRARRVCRDEGLTGLSVLAARRAMARAGVAPGDLGLILCSTLEGDYKTPSLACCIAGELGAVCPAFDLNAACAGFIYALDAASRWLATGAEHVLIVCAERMSRHVDWNDRATCILFGDGAGAAVASRGSSLRALHIATEGGGEHLRIAAGSGNCPFAAGPSPPGFLQMDGRAVFKYAVRAVETGVEAVCAQSGVPPGGVDLFLIHQANRRIVDAVRQRLALPESKFPLNIAEYGNMSSASIPVLLDELIERGEVESGMTLLLSAFGAGMTSGSCIIDW